MTPGTILLINLTNGELRECDRYRLAELGMPAGWRTWEGVTKEELAARIRELCGMAWSQP